VDPAAAFAALTAGVPLLLLPVRIETRFEGPVASRKLKVRIYPDAIHVDAHDPTLTDAEVAIGHAYWNAWHAATDATARDGARQWLATRLTPRRAAWVARTTEPTIGADGALTFPRVRRRTAERQVSAACLPHRWAVVGWTLDAAGALAQRFVAWSAPVPGDIAVGLDPEASSTWSTEEGALPVDPGLAWMIDYDDAVRQGMAVTIDLAQLADVARDGVALLLVVGVRAAMPSDNATVLARLLESQLYAQGLAFAPQGTATNNTDDARSGWSFREPDVDALLARELDGEDRAEQPASDGQRLAAALGIPGNAVLCRLENAVADEETPAQAMNRVLWPVTWGQYFDHLLVSAGGRSSVPASAIADVHDRFIERVRGGAPLPAIRVGAQPYGVLPVRLAEPALEWSSASEWFQETLLFLRDAWTDSLGAVPRLDPVLGAAGGSGDGDPDTVLVDVLASLPHPRRFLLRTLRDWRTEDHASDWLALWAALVGLVWVAGNDPVDGFSSLSVLGRWNWAIYLLGVDEIGGVPGLRGFGIPQSELAGLADPSALRDADAQITALENLRARLPGLVTSDQLDGARSWVDYLIAQVEQHRERQHPLDAMDTAPVEFSGVLGPTVDDPTIAYALYDEDADTKVWTRPLVQSDDAVRGATAADYLAALKTRVPAIHAQPSRARDGQGPTLTAAFHEDEPLLYQLLDGVVDQVKVVEGTAYRAALDVLAALPVDQLELRFRETLGLATHRLDAWFTSIARERLDAMRARRAGGIHLGGYGWLMDLVPDGAGARDSQGFLHAPSLQQATTAAILRSGWTAHGAGDAMSTLAVDLNSDRVRLAAWLLDGVRQGQGLGALLGARFERRLHDDHQDDWIDPLRRAVLQARGITRSPRGPVDGLALADVYASGGLRAVLTDAKAAGDEPALRGALTDLTTALDAVGDAGIAESVHLVAQGNFGRAAATLDAISLGEVPPPELSHVRTPLGGDAVTHRVVALLAPGPDSDADGWRSDARATFDPALEAWMGTLLPSAARVACAATIGGDAGSRLVTMADLGIGALDAVFETPASDHGESAWTRRVRRFVIETSPAAAGREITVDLDVDPGADAADRITFAEMADLTGAVRSLVSRARALDARDLATPDADAAPGTDLAALEARVANLENRFRSAVAALTGLLPAATEEDEHPVGTVDLAVVRAAMMDLAGYELPGAVPTAGWTDDHADRAALYAQAWVLADRALARVTTLDQAHATSITADAASNAPTDVERMSSARTIVDQILGSGFPLLPLFSAPSGVLGAFARNDELLGDDRAATTGWLQQVAKVRADAGLLDTVGMLSELCTGESRMPLTVAQLPRREGEGWVARTAPAPGTGGRVAWLAADHGGLAAIRAGHTLSGFMIDEWIERVPRTTLTTGVAFHFDAPASRAPQSLLLAVPPAVGRAWDFDLVLNTLRQTLEHAQLRAIGPETLAAYGHHLPAIYSPQTLDPGEQPATSETPT
jgi:hypothetical protein